MRKLLSKFYNDYLVAFVAALCELAVAFFRPDASFLVYALPLAAFGVYLLVKRAKAPDKVLRPWLWSGGTALVMLVVLVLTAVL